MHIVGSHVWRKYIDCPEGFNEASQTETRRGKATAEKVQGARTGGKLLFLRGGGSRRIGGVPKKIHQVEKAERGFLHSSWGKKGKRVRVKAAS